MKQRFIIFDLDGTLLDTIADLKNSINQVLETYGFPLLSDQETMERCGHGFAHLVRTALPELEREELFDEALNMFVYYYDLNYFMESKPYPGIPEMLKKLQDEGCRLMVYSNKVEGYTKKLISLNFPGINFEEVWGAREEYPNKPDPRRCEEMIAAKGLDRTDMIMVGDSGSDRRIAENLNIPSVLVSWGFRSEEQLKQDHPDHLVHNTEELAEVLLNY